MGTTPDDVIVVAPATPSGFVRDMPVPGMNVRLTKVLAPVCTTYPLPGRLFKASKLPVGVIVKVLPDPVVVKPLAPTTPMTPPDCVADPVLPMRDVVPPPPPPPPVFVMTMEPGPLVIEMPVPAVNVLILQ